MKISTEKSINIWLILSYKINYIYNINNINNQYLDGIADALYQVETKGVPDNGV